MQSSSSPFSSKPTIEEQQGVLTPHEYIRDSLSFGYKDCISCGNRTEYTCIKCAYCYSCHWKTEQCKETEFRDNLKDSYVSVSKASTDKDDQKIKVKKQQQDGAEDQVQGLEKWGTLDVLGQPAEPICTYYRCHHEFSLHGSRSCRCKHPMNKTLGILS